MNKDNDIVVYDSIDDVLSYIIKTKADVSFWKKRLKNMTTKIPELFRSENIFMCLFEKTVFSINKDFKLIKQFKVLNYRIDSVYIYMDYNYNDIKQTEKENLKRIVLFEFDEPHHIYQEKNDNVRMDEIISTLKSEYDVIEIYRVCENNMYKFLAYAIPFFGNIETSYSKNKLEEVSIYSMFVT